MMTKNLTLLLSGGRLPLSLLHTVEELSRKYSFGVYLTTIQNLRLTEIDEAVFETVKEDLLAAGTDIKGPGRFPKPKVCVGKPHCNLGIVDTALLADKMWDRFKERTSVKPKFKISFAACPASCSNATIADIGIVATRKGFDLYVGGKGGARPQVGRRVLRNASDEQILDAIDQLAAFHDRKTGKKQRMRKLIDDPEFPYLQEV